MNNFTKLMMLISTLVLLIGGGISFYLTYQGYQPVAVTNQSADGIAIEGFDTVAYHTIGVAQKGSHNFQVTWSASIWYFTSPDNRQSFSDDPEKYAPLFGGYDPYGMPVSGAAQPATPELWETIGDKLYLFYSGQTRTLWQENRAQNLKNANNQWTKIKQQILYKVEMEKGHED